MILESSLALRLLLAGPPQITIQGRIYLLPAETKAVAVVPAPAAPVRPAPVKAAAKPAAQPAPAALNKEKPSAEILSEEEAVESLASTEEAQALKARLAELTGSLGRLRGQGSAKGLADAESWLDAARKSLAVGELSATSKCLDKAQAGLKALSKGPADQPIRW